MNLNDAMELTKKYSHCPECGNGNVGGTPSQGALIIEDDTFTRRCKCGWSVTINKRIKVIATATSRKKGKTIGVFELKIHGRGHKFVDLNELKEKSGAKRINQTKLIEEWLNTKEGRDWAISTPKASIFF